MIRDESMGKIILSNFDIFMFTDIKSIEMNSWCREEDITVVKIRFIV
jgi:hypothetical protein